MLIIGGQSFAYQAQPRIQQLYLNKATTQKIYLSSGLASSVKMPCEIDEIITPGSGILNHISERNKTRFSLEISNSARSTNFIVHCIDSTYVFDLIVNQKIHNDYIEIIGDYGIPRLTQYPYKKSEMTLNKKIILSGNDKLNRKVENIQLNQSIVHQMDLNRTSLDLNQIEKIKIYDSQKEVINE